MRIAQNLFEHQLYLVQFNDAELKDPASCTCKIDEFRYFLLGSINALSYAKLIKREEYQQRYSIIKQHVDEAIKQCRSAVDNRS